ncbi:LysR family transcriptional regulator, partial [Hungatella hathewayi]
MTLRHMKIFVTVYQNKGITSASQILHLAQPSVSLAIRELEEYYGIHLFERIGRRIYPTECGKDFYGYALHIVSLFDEMETKVRNWDAIGTLRIGASVTIGTHLLPGILKRASILYPDLTIKVLINNSTYIEEHLMDNTIDVGLIETRPELPDLVYEPFMK